MLRVLHVSESIKGGVSTYLNTLVREQIADPRISDLRVVSNRAHRKYLPDVPDDRLLEFDYPGRSLRGLHHLSGVVRRAVRDFQPTLVQLTSTFPGVVGRFNTWNRRWLTSRHGPAVVYCAQGWSFLMETGRVKHWLYRTTERLLAGQTDRIICISNHELEACIKAGISRARCDLVYNALPKTTPIAEPVTVPSAVAAARNRGDRVFLFVGRYDRQKGVDLLRPAFDGPSDRGDILLMAGGNVVDDTPTNFGSRMFDTGWATPGQVVTLLEMSDALLVPSRWEGFGLVATEAMRAARAVICSGRGGLPEVVDNGRTGIVLKSLDSGELAQVIRNVTSDQLREFGDAGRQRFLNLFTSDAMHESTLSVYQRALERRT